MKGWNSCSGSAARGISSGGIDNREMASGGDMMGRCIAL